MLDIYVSKGNLSEDKDVFIFNLPAIETCPNHTLCASTCYARKSERVWKGVLPSRKRNLLATRDPRFVQDMVEKLKKATKVRIHESGDFYSDEYIKQWADIIRALPNTKFKCFTKVLKAYDVLKALPNVAVHLSILPGGELNYGSDADMDKMAKKYLGAFICPKKRAKTHECSTFSCTECFNKLRKHILFTKH